jgi:hypothetical protein
MTASAAIHQPPPASAGLKAWRDAAQAQIPQTVIIACGLSGACGPSCPGEPFILAVTPLEVVALRPGQELARWSRGELRVSWRRDGDRFDVTLASALDREDLHCHVARTYLHQQFLTLLATRLDPCNATSPPHVPREQ